MAASQYTPERVKMLLSSFIHTESKPKLADNSEPSELTKEIESTLSQPRNRVAFYKRVHTFSSLSWFAKPSWLSPMQCARFGWENVDVDMLQCVSCGACVSGRMPGSYEPQVYEDCCKKLADSLRTGHHQMCPWTNNPSPEMFLDIPIEDHKDAVQWLQEQVRHLCLLNFNLPKIQEETLLNMGLSDVQLQRLTALCPGITDENHRDVQEMAVVLAVTGWQNMSASQTSLMSCYLCNRQAGLWGFHSLVGDAEEKKQSSCMGEDSSDDSAKQVQESTQIQESVMLTGGHSGQSNSGGQEEGIQRLHQPVTKKDNASDSEEQTQTQNDDSNSNKSKSQTDEYENSDTDNSDKSQISDDEDHKISNVSCPNDNNVHSDERSNDYIVKSSDGVIHSDSDAADETLETQLYSTSAPSIGKDTLVGYGPSISGLEQRNANGDGCPEKMTGGEQSTNKHGHPVIKVTDCGMIWTDMCTAGGDTASEQMLRCGNIDMQLDRKLSTSQNGSSAYHFTTKSQSEQVSEGGTCATQSDHSGEPVCKKKKIHVPKSYLQPLQEHRSWCPWVFPSCRQINGHTTAGITQWQQAEKSVPCDDQGPPALAACGWQKFLQLLLPDFSPENQQRIRSIVKTTPPHEALRSIRRLFKDWTSPTQAFSGHAES